MATDKLQFRFGSPKLVLASNTSSMVSRIGSAVQAEVNAATRGIRFGVLGFAEEVGILTFVVESDNRPPGRKHGGRFNPVGRIKADKSQIYAVLQSGELPKRIPYLGQSAALPQTSVRTGL